MTLRPSLILSLGLLGAVLCGYWSSEPQSVEQNTQSPPLEGIPKRTSHGGLLATETQKDGNLRPLQGDASPAADASHDAWVNAAEIPKLRDQQKWHQSLHRAAAPELAKLSTDEMIALLPEQYQEQARDYHRQLGSLDPEFRRYICWAPDVPDDVVQTFRRIEVQGGMAPGEVRIQANQFLGSGHWNRTALSGSNNNVQGRPVTLTWSIAPDNTLVPGLSGGSSASNLRAWLSGIYGTNGGAPENEPWFTLFEQAFEDLSSQTGLRFVYQALDTGSSFSSFRTGSTNTRGDIRIGARTLDGNSGTLAFAYAPDYGDIVFDSADSFFNNTTSNSIRFINVLTHELGHALGLDHVCPVNTTKLMEPFASTNFRGLQFDDIYSLQRQYGDNFEVHDNVTNNDSSPVPTDLDFTEEVNASWQWLSIDGSSDTDYYRFTTVPNRAVTIRITPSDPVSSGNTYLEGAQNTDGSCSAGAAFDPTNRQNLSLELLDINGSSVLASSTLATAGQAEEITEFVLPDGGAYFIRVAGDNTNAAQLYQLELLVEAQPDMPTVKVIAHSLVDESNSPANALPDPGETIQLAVDINNTGGLEATDLQASLSGPNGFTGFVTSTSGINLAPSATTQLIFTFALDGECGETFDLIVDLTASGNYQTSATIPLTLGTSGSTTPIEANFENSSSFPSGWASTSTGNSQPWAVTNANADTGSQAVSGSSVSAVGESIITSPSTVLGSTGGTLSFRHDYNTETGFDGGVLEASLDGGAWFDLLNTSGVNVTGGYNDTISTNYQSPIAGRDAWSGDSGGYTTASVELPAAWQGRSIRFRWILASDASVQDEGWYIDNVSLVTDISNCLDFRPTLSISADGTTLEEGNEASIISGIISTPLPLAQEVTVTLMTSGTADVADLSGGLDLILPSGQTSVTFQLLAAADSEIEGIENLLIFIPDDQPGFTPSPFSQISLTIEEPQVTFASWQEQFPNLDPSPEADDDGDQWNNLYEYTFGTNPQGFNSQPSITHQLTSTTFEINHPAVAIPHDIELVGETSTDLFSWTKTGVTQTTNGFSVTRDGLTRYLRLRATLLTPPQ